MIQAASKALAVNGQVFQHNRRPTVFHTLGGTWVFSSFLKSEEQKPVSNNEFAYVSVYYPGLWDTFQYLHSNWPRFYLGYQYKSRGAMLQWIEILPNLHWYGQGQHLSGCAFGVSLVYTDKNPPSNTQCCHLINASSSLVLVCVEAPQDLSLGEGFIVLGAVRKQSLPYRAPLRLTHPRAIADLQNR